MELDWREADIVAVVVVVVVVVVVIVVGGGGRRVAAVVEEENENDLRSLSCRMQRNSLQIIIVSSLLMMRILRERQ